MMTRAVAHGSLPAGTRTSAGVATTREVVLVSRLTCPVCGHVEVVTMPADACMWLYECKGCKALMRARAGDCCVFCSYGSVPCPSVQEQQACGHAQSVERGVE